MRDISERRRAEEARKKETTLIQLLQSVTVAANQSSTIEHTAQTCLDRICSYTGWPVGHVYLRANNSPEELIPAGLWHVGRAGRFAAFRETSERWRFVPGAGLPGRVLASGKPEWMVDLADEDPVAGANSRGGAGRAPVGIRVPDIGGGEGHRSSGVLFA